MKIKPAFKFLVTPFLMVLTVCGEIKTKITVVNDDGFPIKGAEVRVIFQDYQPKNDIYINRFTNEDGQVELNGTPRAAVRVTVNSDGYYSSDFKDLNPLVDLDLKICLRDKKNPIPLYAKKIFLKMPVAGSWVGFDFESADFTAPYGSGRFNDLKFKMTSVKTLENGSVFKGEEGKLELSFSEENDGFFFEEVNFFSNSELQMPHLAPESGYQNSFVRSEKSFTNSKVKLNTGVFFRVRSLTDRNGKIERANYGKFSSDLRFDPRESGWHVSHRSGPKYFGSITFTYYFNPQANDRNLEFDPSRNLFTNLPRDEQVLAP